MTAESILLDPIAIHVVATTAEAGAQFRRSTWAQTVAYAVRSRNISRHLFLRHYARMRALNPNWKPQ